MAKSIHFCAKTLHLLMRKHKRARATLTADFFREIVDRSRIEESFIDALNEYAIDTYQLAIVKLTRSKYLLARTYDRYFVEDEHVWEDE